MNIKLYKFIIVILFVCCILVADSITIKNNYIQQQELFAQNKLLMHQKAVSSQKVLERKITDYREFLPFLYNIQLYQESKVEYQFKLLREDWIELEKQK